MSNWDDILLRAHAEKEELKDLTITTLASHYSDRVLSEALEKADMLNSEYLEQLKQEIADSGNVYVQEFVSIDDDYNVTLCIDVPEVNDQVIDHLIDNLECIDFSKPGIIKIGDPKTFKYEQIRNINELEY